MIHWRFQACSPPTIEVARKQVSLPQKGVEFLEFIGSLLIKGTIAGPVWNSYTSVPIRRRSSCFRISPVKRKGPLVTHRTVYC
jgi:hypothetical protein